MIKHILFIFALVLLVACGPASPTTSPTAWPATATARPSQETPTSLPIKASPSPMPTASPVDSEVPDCPLPASLTAPAIARFEPIDGRGAIAYSGDGLQLVFPTSLLTATVHSLSALGLTGVDKNFAWSPDTTQIAFLYTDPRPDPCGYGYLMLADLTRGEVRPLTQQIARYGQPAWSPDGRRLALTNDAGQLSVVLIDDDSVLILSDRAAPLGTPGWLDAKHIVYAERAKSNNRTNLVSQTWDGSAAKILLQDVNLYTFSLAPNRRQVAYDSGGSVYLADLQSGSSQSLGTYPSERLQWSPDGQYVLGRFGLAGIFLAQSDGSAPARQVNFLGLPGLMQSWSPDASRFAALIGPEEELPTIGLYEVATQTLTDLSIVVQRPYALAWSQAGLKVGSILLSDLDGDGQAEIVAQQTWSSVAFDYIDQQHQIPKERESMITWILDRGPDGWFAVPLGYGYGEQGEIEKSVPIPGTPRQAVRLSSSLWGWDGRQAVSLDPQTWTAMTDPARCPLRWP